MIKLLNSACTRILMLFLGIAVLTACQTMAQEKTYQSGSQDRRAQIRLELAVNYFADGKLGIALEELENALRFDPKLADAYNLRGLIYLQQNNLNQAESSFQRAVTLSNNDPSIVHNYAWSLCRMGNYERSLQLFEQVLQSSGYQNRIATYLTQGLCYAKNEQPLLAEIAFRRGVDIDANNPLLRYELANLLFNKGDYNAAQTQMREVNNQQYSNAKTLWLGILIERELGQQDAVFQLAQQLERHYSDSAEWQWYKSRQFQKQSESIF